MRRKSLGCMIIMVAFVFGVIETGYFGWNVFPKSGEEMVCDGISLLIWAIGTSMLLKWK